MKACRATTPYPLLALHCVLSVAFGCGDSPSTPEGETSSTTQAFVEEAIAVCRAFCTPGAGPSCGFGDGTACMPPCLARILPACNEHFFNQFECFVEKECNDRPGRDCDLLASDRASCTAIKDACRACDARAAFGPPVWDPVCEELDGDCDRTLDCLNTCPENPVYCATSSCETRAICDECVFQGSAVERRQVCSYTGLCDIPLVP